MQATSALPPELTQGTIFRDSVLALIQQIGMYSVRVIALLDER